jgi:hypothetical protein
MQPIQWNPNWGASDCKLYILLLFIYLVFTHFVFSGEQSCPGGQPVDVIVTIELRFVDENIVEVMTQVESQEPFNHAGVSPFPSLSPLSLLSSCVLIVFQSLGKSFHVYILLMVSLVWICQSLKIHQGIKYSLSMFILLIN